MRFHVKRFGDRNEKKGTKFQKEAKTAENGKNMFLFYRVKFVNVC